MLTMTDLFYGAGGSSSGAIEVPGVEIRMASNHWDLAVETHNENHPPADHDCADLSAVDPRRYPRTDILWASPECTNHSQAKGIKRNQFQPDLFGDNLPDAAQERSRATMWDVPRFAEVHRYRAVIVENVVDAAKWIMFPAWLQAMELLGYEHQTVWLNSMHAQTGGLPAPQSRDRMYVVFWRKGDHKPDLAAMQRPPAFCTSCGEVVESVQVWKKEGRKWGRYRQQYIYCCSRCSSTVEPAYLPAYEAIDWSLPGERIGDRSKPLAPKTLARIKAGLEKYGRAMHIEAAGNTFERGGYARAWPVDEVFKTIHATASKALVVPLRTHGKAEPATAPLKTLVAGNVGHALIMRNNTARGDQAQMVTPVSEVIRTLTTTGHQSLLIPYYGSGRPGPVTEPHRTFSTRDRFGLLVPAGGTWNEEARPTTDPMRTRTTRDTEAICSVETSVDDCRFRMLEPHEIQAGMAFGDNYIVLGNKRERVRQLGNAVTPPAARDLVGAVVSALIGEVG